MKPKKELIIEPSGEFAASVRDFRSAVTHIAERETARPVSADWLSAARKRRRNHQQRMALSWACAALLFVVTLPWLGHSRHIPSAHPVAQTASPAIAPESDSALLEQVDADVSESVPSSLAPLAELDNLNTTSATRTSVSARQGTALTQREKTNAAR